VPFGKLDHLVLVQQKLPLALVLTDALPNKVAVRGRPQEAFSRSVIGQEMYPPHASLW
jgi:hypothetical protein